MVIRHWEDVVFENRNKSYGAYFLRRAYAQRLLLGLGVTVAVMALLLFWQKQFPQETINVAVPPPLTGGGLRPYPPPPIERKKPAQATSHQQKKSQSNRSVLVTTNEIVEKEQVTALEEFISGEDFEIGPVGTPEGTGTTLSLPEPEVLIRETPLDIAEVMPQYQGGLEAMMKFIQKKIRYPRVPRQMGIDGTVYVRFVVNGDGTITDVEILRGVHPDYDREAMRVISMLPAWKGGSHNGRPVSVRMVLPIKFNLR